MLASLRSPAQHNLPHNFRPASPSDYQDGEKSIGPSEK